MHCVSEASPPRDPRLFRKRLGGKKSRMRVFPSSSASSPYSTSWDARTDPLERASRARPPESVARVGCFSSPGNSEEFPAPKQPSAIFLPTVGCGILEKARGVRDHHPVRTMARNHGDEIDHHSPTSSATSSKVVVGGAIFCQRFGSHTSK